MGEERDIVEGRRLSGCLTPHETWTAGCERCEHLPPPEIFEAAIKSLRHATVEGLCDDDGSPYPLIDMLSEKGDGTVGPGIDRAERIAEEVATDIWPAIKAREGTLRSQVERLREALDVLLFVLDHENPWDTAHVRQFNAAVNYARAALAKAEGKEPSDG